MIQLFSNLRLESGLKSFMPTSIFYQRRIEAEEAKIKAKQVAIKQARSEMEYNIRASWLSEGQKATLNKLVKSDPVGALSMYKHYRDRNYSSRGYYY